MSNTRFKPFHWTTLERLFQSQEMTNAPIYADKVDWFQVRENTYSGYPLLFVFMANIGIPIILCEIPL